MAAASSAPAFDRRATEGGQGVAVQREDGSSTFSFSRHFMAKGVRATGRLWFFSKVWLSWELGQ